MLVNRLHACMHADDMNPCMSMTSAENGWLTSTTPACSEKVDLASILCNHISIFGQLVQTHTKSVDILAAMG